VVKEYSGYFLWLCSFSTYHFQWRELTERPPGMQLYVLPPSPRTAQWLVYSLLDLDRAVPVPHRTYGHHTPARAAACAGSGGSNGPFRFKFSSSHAAGFGVASACAAPRIPSSTDCSNTVSLLAASRIPCFQGSDSQLYSCRG